MENRPTQISFKVALSFALTFLSVVVCRADNDISDLQNQLSISQSRIMTNLSNYGFSFSRILKMEAGPRVSGVKDVGQPTRDVFANPRLKPVLSAVEADLKAFAAKDPGAGVGVRYGHRLFDLNFLRSEFARLTLIGVVFRPDRAFVEPETCGETRLIYRLAYRVNVPFKSGAETGVDEIYSRLPMTVNLVYRLKRSVLAQLLNVSPESACQSYAKRWKNYSDFAMKTDTKLKEVWDYLLDATDAHQESPILERLFELSNLKALELNLQMVRWPAAARPDFGGHSVYLLKVFHLNERNEFQEAPMENQVDFERLAEEPRLKKEFKDYLLKADRKQIEAGTLLIPERFLAKKALSTAPAGFHRVQNQPYSLHLEKDILQPLGKLAVDRLNQMTCTGCHQTRGTAGFHFVGVDPYAIPGNEKVLMYPGNSIFTPASPHFYSDLPRRGKIFSEVLEGADTTKLDYSRGDSRRPEDPWARQRLAGSGLLDGWGAHCSLGKRPEYKGWTCAAGLECKPVVTGNLDEDTGVCLSRDLHQVGEPCEFGRVTTKGASDSYAATWTTPVFDPQRYVCSPQRAPPGKSTGGFPGTSLRTQNCENLPGEASCGALPAAQPGFNACIGRGESFIKCVERYAIGIGLRYCDATNPCRDDYICARGLDMNKGACVPPYFLFQFRVDGHPLSQSAVSKPKSSGN